ncbi:type IV toxin-antitoxin system AbiEi family antitoxin domain-containing protein [Psychromicrobium xiongbiense]|uniref:type IV toxin-antitoxin system AbiEi family antitoxin domain-containing protein n=1 Tax=Psychromicrobium xiongbiense TaxID=3051184 RepID=UPI002552EF7B|nr:type IV toxin-antitoxin system AbiEi family antitoxin domain-containing protein [Psychromicrobium sp. YIM S02556]
MDLVKWMAARGGIARRKALIRAGFSDRKLRRAVDSGIVSRLHPGTYALPTSAPAYLSAARNSGLLTCVSAAEYYHLWQLREPEEVHLQLPPHVQAPDARPHRLRRVASPAAAPVASLVDVLLDALRCRPWDESLVMVQCAVGRGDIHLDFLRDRLSGGRNSPARKVLDMVRFRADSLLECLLAARLMQAGIPFEQHVRLAGIGEVDFVIAGRLIVELDGGTHFEPRQIKRDRRRDNAAASAGYASLRYFYDDVVHQPERTMAQIGQVLRTASKF